MSEQLASTEHPVSPLELFFDLVFVFAFTQVTTLLSNNATWSGLGHALLILTAVWWAWASYAWLTNTVDPGVGAVLAAVLVAVAAMFIAALAVPGTFGDEGVVFGVGFLIVCVMYVTLYALTVRGDPDFLDAVLRFAPLLLGGAVLILVAGFVGGGARVLLWCTALAVGFFGPGLVRVTGWRVHPAHFVERHGLIVIIAIGESLVAIGLGAQRTNLDAGEIATALLGLLVATSFWLAYFDFFTLRARQLLDNRTGDDQITLARDVFTYLHLPIVIGIILFAFGTKITLAHRSDELGTVEAVCLCGGSALFLAAFVALRWRVARAVRGGRLVATIACLALIPVARVVPAIVALALVAAVWVALHAYELIWWREARAEARALRYSAPT